MRTIIQQIPRFFNYYNVLFLLDGIASTLLLTFIGCGAGLILGSLLVYTRLSKSPWLLPIRILLIGYVEFFRRIPFLVILFIVLFGAPIITPDISLFGIGAVSVCLLSTAFLSEIIRAGVESIPRPQTEAAEVMSFSRLQTVWFVVLPQAWKVILPPGLSFCIMFIKDTSLASQIGVVELMYTGKILANRGYSAMLVYGTILLCYFAISYPLSRFGGWVEQALRVSRGQTLPTIPQTSASLAEI
jgi:polar amino acid transport system permease protein